jgi:hypothetical protein
LGAANCAFLEEAGTVQNRFPIADSRDAVVIGSEDI